MGCTWTGTFSYTHHANLICSFDARSDRRLSSVAKTPLSFDFSPRKWNEKSLTPRLDQKQAAAPTTTLRVKFLNTPIISSSHQNSTTIAESADSVTSTTNLYSLMKNQKVNSEPKYYTAPSIPKTSTGQLTLPELDTPPRSTLSSSNAPAPSPHAHCHTPQISACRHSVA